eukprot:14362-Heterococcus_DN1.PRE.2
MVIKTDTCQFSEFRIYPGHGIRFVRRDGTANCACVYFSFNCTASSAHHIQVQEPADAAQEAC